MGHTPHQSFHHLRSQKLLASMLLFICSIVFCLPVIAQEAPRPATKVAAKPVEPFYRAIPEGRSLTYEPNITYLSPEKTAPITFSGLGASWQQYLPVGTSALLEVRFKKHGQYSDWYPLEPSIDDHQESEEENHSLSGRVSSFLTTNLADTYQYRIRLESQIADQTPILENLQFTFINAEYTPEPPHLATIQESSGQTAGKVRVHPLNRDLQVSLLTTGSSLTAQAETPTVFSREIRSNLRPPILPESKPSITVPVSTGPVRIISRQEWGADESLRLYRPVETPKTADVIKVEDDYYTKFADELKESRRVETDSEGRQLTWPLSYPESIKKIVIHHTATVKNLDDPAKAIRDIYIWHTLSKGWGDIGYNYIIDQQGNIYEGRFGGEMVVGAHAGRGNHGSIGIAVLGNYQDDEPAEAVLSSLAALIQQKAAQYNIDTEGASTFRGENYPNVMGHREVMSTSCPGDRLYALLPILRKLAKVEITAAGEREKTREYQAAWAGSGAPVITMQPSSRKNIVLKIKNSGMKTWGAQTTFQIVSDQTSQNFLKNHRDLRSEKIGHEVRPGQSVDVKFALQSGSISGSGLIKINPSINGAISASSLTMALQVATPPPKLAYDYELLSTLYSKYDFERGEVIDVQVRLRNKGTATWQKNGVNKLMLGADKARDHYNKLLVIPSTRLAGLIEDQVKPGESANFAFQIRIPEQEGTYREYFTPVVEAVQWMENKNTFLQIVVDKNTAAGNPSLEEGESVRGPAPLRGAAESISKIPGIAPRAISKPVETFVSTPAAAASSTPASSSVNIASTQFDTATAPRPVRVDLSYRGNPAVISGSGTFSLFEGVRHLADFSAEQKVNVEFKNNIFLVSSNGQTFNISSKPRFVPSHDSVIMRIDNWERRNTWGDKANNNLFRGVLEALIYNGEMHIINELPLEDYLKGIAEESSTAPDEKIKTIMVIARTYARYYMDIARKFPGAPFDLNDDPNYSQKYLGYAFESRSPKTARLATETAGQYVTYQGKLIKTPYFSKSDGKRTISARDKWGWTDTPFLSSVDDSHCQSTAFSGHGVGLSGCGATALANSGKSYQDIIKYYYQGTEITRAK